MSNSDGDKGQKSLRDLTPEEARARRERIKRKILCQLISLVIPTILLIVLTLLTLLLSYVFLALSGYAEWYLRLFHDLESDVLQVKSQLSTVTDFTFYMVSAFLNLSSGVFFMLTLCFISYLCRFFTTRFCEIKHKCLGKQLIDLRCVLPFSCAGLVGCIVVSLIDALYFAGIERDWPEYDSSYVILRLFFLGVEYVGFLLAFSTLFIQLTNAIGGISTLWLKRRHMKKVKNFVLHTKDKMEFDDGLSGVAGGASLRSGGGLTRIPTEDNPLSDLRRVADDEILRSDDDDSDDAMMALVSDDDDYDDGIGIEVVDDAPRSIRQSDRIIHDPFSQDYDNVPVAVPVAPTTDGYAFDASDSDHDERDLIGGLDTPNSPKGESKFDPSMFGGGGGGSGGGVGMDFGEDLSDFSSGDDDDDDVEQYGIV